MEKPPFQFGLKAVFAAMTGAAALSVAMKDALLLDAMAYMVVAVSVGFPVCTIGYLVYLSSLVALEPTERQPSRFQFYVAAFMVASTAALFLGLFVVMPA
jgi:hypothetical protein